MTKSQPKFVNLQPSAVTIPNGKGGTMYVYPFARREQDSDACFVVEGEYYAQFVSARGPLYPFPSDILAAEEAAAEKAAEVLAANASTGGSGSSEPETPKGNGETSPPAGSGEPGGKGAAPKKSLTPEEVAEVDAAAKKEAARLKRNATARAKRKAVKRKK